MAIKLTKFRILRFRSILDSGWAPFSSDRVTVLIGQNESGKTAVLEALAAAFDRRLSEEDLRVGEELPEVHFEAEIPYIDLVDFILPLKEWQKRAVVNYLGSSAATKKLVFSWFEVDSNRKFHAVVRLADESALKEIYAIEEAAQFQIENMKSEGALTYEAWRSSEPEFDLVSGILNLLPQVALFNAASGHLPDHCEIESFQPRGSGEIAAQNFLEVAGLDLKGLLDSGALVRENILRRANERIAAEFASFWTQDLGRAGKIAVSVDIKHHPTEHEHSGRPYLAFRIRDAATQLYPKQRSEGVRWFVSFFLQLKASEKRKFDRLFLMDEPGANLHARAQVDVLQLLSKLSTKLQIVYSTHSAHMVEYEKLYRVIAVQREDVEGSPTILKAGHHLGAASVETLSPVLSAMGIDLSHQRVIRVSRNVLLEEISGYYYLTAFWRLCGRTDEANFVAATGASNVETLANLFLGWGLDFIVAVDDDREGRRAKASLARTVFVGESDPNCRIVKMDQKAIEDIFSLDDMEKHLGVSPRPGLQTSGEVFRATGVSKPLVACKFAQSVAAGEIVLSDLDVVTSERISKLVREIAEKLDARPKR